ncbi:MAG: ectoine hydroxylase-related dioxygenase (phytanoyl-CoA dioxygenase family) [Bacillariaceae sp.]
MSKALKATTLAVRLIENADMRMQFLSYLVAIISYYVSSFDRCEAFVLVPGTRNEHYFGSIFMARKRFLLASTSSTSSSTTTTTEFKGGFDIEQMDALTQRGVLEASIMQAPGELEEIGTKNKSNNNKKKTKKTKKENKGPSTAIITRALNQDGVVRLNGILSKSTATTLREEILVRRNDAYATITTSSKLDNDEAEDSSNNNNENSNWRNYFADVLLKRNRCDLLLPLKGNRNLQAALYEILVTSNRLSNILPNDATLYELSSLISDPNSPRQPVHPDNPFQQHPPLHTIFIALQDITDQMGGTIFLPKTNTAEAHSKYNDIPNRDEYLKSSPNVAALLNAGDASLFDSRTMHCGGANDEMEGSTRVLLYMSFRNPKATEAIGNVGSIMSDIKPMTIGELRSKLTIAMQQSSSDNNNNEDYDDPFDDEMILPEKEDTASSSSSTSAATRLAATNGDAIAQLQLGINYYVGENGCKTNHVEAVRWFELAAKQGLAHAQFNLGCCYSMGIGVPQQDVERAMELFQLAAEQKHPGAKEAFDEALSQQKKKIQS